MYVCVGLFAKFAAKAESESKCKRSSCVAAGVGVTVGADVAAVDVVRLPNILRHVAWPRTLRPLKLKQKLFLRRDSRLQRRQS